jgi:pimeloyl-ACP methyl ester carboxylesterase
LKLFFEKFGQGAPLFILHGLLGMSDNWKSIGKKLSEKFCVYLIDARNHGRSPHNDNFGYDEMVDDLLELIKQENINRLSIIGHSMGGKTAMILACENPHLVDKLIVVDISPAAGKPPEEQLRLLNIMNGFDPGSYKTFSELNLALEPLIRSDRLRAFVLKNIKRSSGGPFSWKPNIPVLLEKFSTLGLTLPDDLRFNGPVLFVKGELSDFIGVHDLPVIEKHFPDAEISTIIGARHWVHADKPVEFLAAVKEFISTLMSSPGDPYPS